MSDFSALHVALSGLQAARVGIDTTSHNISNASTEGFTRQRVELAARFPRSMVFGQVGLGAEILDITRARDAFLDNRFRTDVEASGFTRIRADLLSKTENALGEPEAGITAELAGLWSSFEELALNPPDSASRLNVISQLESTALRIRSVTGAWGQLAETETFALSTTVDEVNDLLHQVANLNQAIREAGASGGTPNDLLDQRDLVLDELSQKIGIRAIDQGDGTVRVSLSGMALVSEVSVSELTFEPSSQAIMHPTGVELAVGGAAKGFQTFLREDLPSFQGALDDFVSEFADELNTMHAAGWVSSTESGGDLFTYDPTDPSGTLAVAITDPDRLAVSANPGPPFPTFDSGNADALAGLRFSLSAAGGTDTFEGVVRSIVTDLGQATASAATAARAQDSLLSSSDRARMSTHGVSIDEEMVSMLEYQRMYEAAARVMTAIDEALDVLINRTGVVGR